MIPNQLKNAKFCRVRKGEKAPFEKGWQNKPYTFEQIKQYFPQENYGVLTGFDELGVLDDDSEHEKLLNLFHEKFGETFRVRGHYYVRLKGWDGKKIIFHDSENNHLGELQGLGQQAVGPGSKHPSGEFYKLENDSEIKEIPFEKFKSAFYEYLPASKKEDKESPEIEKNQDWQGDDLGQIPLTDIFPTASFVNKGDGKLQGPHPVHGSNNTGMNFMIDIYKNQWTCYRDWHSGGGPWTAIAMMEGLISCEDTIGGCKLDEETRKEVVKIAIDKYGLNINLDEKKSNWIHYQKYNSLDSEIIDIYDAAKFRDLTKCPDCKVNFDFSKKNGLFACPSCGKGGGLRKLIKLSKVQE